MCDMAVYATPKFDQVCYMVNKLTFDIHYCYEPHGFMVAFRLCTHIVMYVHHIRWMVTNFSTVTKDNITEGTNRRQQRAKKTPMAGSRVKVITELGMLGPFLLFKVQNRPVNSHGNAGNAR